jgi:hypothetical protein
MAFFQNLFKPAPPKVQPVAAPPAVSVPPVPQQLPKISAPTAAEIVPQTNPSPEAQKILAANPQQTPSQYLNALQEKQMGGEMTKTLAHGMPDREGVMWASQSAEKVSGSLPPEDATALKAAQAWVKNPTEANQATAAAAAAKTNYQGPGAWAAQGAAWSQPTTPTAASVPTAMPRLTPDAVVGAVLLSAAIKANPALAAPKAQVPTLQAPATTAPILEAPQSVAAVPSTAAVIPPEVQAQIFREQQPFIASGIDIASGKTPCG